MQQWLERISTGDSGTDLLVVLLAVSVVGALAALRAAFRSSSAPRTVPGGISEQASSYPLGGKIERLERTLSEFRTEALRTSEILSQKVEQSQKTLAAIEKALKLPPSADPAGPGRSSSNEEASRSLPADRLPTDRLPTDSASADIVGDAAPEPTIAQPSTAQSSTSSAAVSEAPPASLASRLGSTRRGLFEKLRSVFLGKPKLDAEMVEELRALLISADLGVRTVQGLLAEVQESLTRGQQVDEDGFTVLLKDKLMGLLGKDAPSQAAIVPQRMENGPKVVLVVGVNGVGKTTTVAKLAHQWKSQGARVLLVAADTFRAAAVAQLSEWASRLDLPVVTGPDGAKPSTVVFDAMERASKEDFDIIVVDTAGRLQTKSNLMQELSGIRAAIERHQGGAPHETILVVDGSTGQNAISQAREFNEAAKLTGLIVTKLDGTPKGGVVVAIKDEFGIPVRYIGVGESPSDLREFKPRDFVEALFERGEGDDDKVVPFVLSEHGEQRRRRRSA